MYKLLVLAAILAVTFAVPTPEAKADPKAAAKPHGFIAAAYTAPVVAAAPVAYSATYSAPLAYAAAPLTYSAYPAYSAYAAPYVSIF